MRRRERKVLERFWPRIFPVSVSSSPFIVVVLTGDQERTERDREEVRGVRGKEDRNTKEIERGLSGLR